MSEKPCGAYFFAFFEKCFVPILTSGGLAAVSSSAFAALYSAFGKYDVVHIHAEGPAFFAWLPKMFGKRVVVTVHPLLYLEQRYGTEKSFMESWLPVAGIALCLRMLNCLVYDVTGTALFPTLIAGQIRGGHSTSICGAIENIYLIYSFYLLLKCGKDIFGTRFGKGK